MAAKTVLNVDGVVPVPKKRRQFRPQAPRRQPLLVRADFMGLFGCLDGEPDIDRASFLISPDATWSDLHEAVVEAHRWEGDDEMKGGVHYFFVRPDGTRPSLKVLETHRNGYRSGHRITGWRDQKYGLPPEGDVDGETCRIASVVGHEWVSTLVIHHWSREYVSILTFFECDDHVIDRVGRSTGTHVESFRTEDCSATRYDNVYELRPANRAATA